MANDLYRQSGPAKTKLLLDHTPERSTLEQWYLSIGNIADITAIEQQEASRPDEMLDEDHLALNSVHDWNNNIHTPALNAVVTAIVERDPNWNRPGEKEGASIHSTARSFRIYSS